MTMPDWLTETFGWWVDRALQMLSFIIEADIGDVCVVRVGLDVDDIWKWELFSSEQNLCALGALGSDLTLRCYSFLLLVSALPYKALPLRLLLPQDAHLWRC